jgi:hypothetical protein
MQGRDKLESSLTSAVAHNIRKPTVMAALLSASKEPPFFIGGQREDIFSIE